MAFGMHSTTAPTNVEIKLERNELERQLGALRLKIDNAQRDADAIVDRKAELAQKEALLADLVQKIVANEAKLSNLDDLSKEATTSRQAAQGELEKAKADKVTLEREIALKRADFEKEQKRQQDTLDSLDIEINAAKITLRSLNDQIQEQVHTIKNNEATKGAKAVEISTLKTQIDTLTGTHEALKNDHAKLKADHTTALDQHEHTKGELAATKQSRTNESDQHAKAVAEADRIVKDAQAKADQIILSAQQSIQAKNLDLERREGSLSDRISWVQSKENYLRTVVKEIEKIRHKPLGITFGEA